jgi:hypothetical protein
MEDQGWPLAIEGAVTYGRALAYVTAAEAAGLDVLDDSVRFDWTATHGESAGRETSEKIALDALALAGVVYIGPRLVQDREEGNHLLRTFGSAIVTNAERAGVQPAWELVGKAFLLAAEEGITQGDHLAALQVDEEPTGGTAARICGHGLLSLRPDVDLGQALVSQRGIVSTLRSRSIYAPAVSTYCLAVEEYWRQSLASQRFRFRWPDVLEEELGQAVALPGGQRIQSVLRSVAESLAVPPPSAP